MNKEFYKDGNFWRTKSPQWEIDAYGEAIDGKGDLIFNTMYKIIEDEDMSPWVAQAINEAYQLLRDGKRWPDRMNQEIDAKGWIEWYFSKLMYKLRLSKNVKYRPQKDLTRDPFILFYAAQIHYYGEIKFKVKLPIRLWRPTYGLWYWRMFHPNKKEYCERLDYYKWLSLAMLYEAKQ